MNLFTRNSPYYHLLKYLLFLLKHPVYGVVLNTVATLQLFTPISIRDLLNDVHIMWYKMLE